MRPSGPAYALDAYPSGLDEGETLRVVGAGVEVEPQRDRVVVRDAATGAELWRAPVPGSQVRSIRARGELVAIEEYHDPLLLHEWFAPRDPRTVTLVVRDARTGETRASVRHDFSSDQLTMAGDRVLLNWQDRHGESQGRMIDG